MIKIFGNLKLKGLYFMGVSLLLSITTSARYEIGRCFNPSLVENFNASAYAGFWYEIYRDIATPFELNGDCVTATYGVVGERSLSVYNRMINSKTGKVEDVTGTA